MSGTVYHKSRHKARPLHYMAQDWPDDMKISHEAFEEYAARIEQDDFEDDIRGLCASLHQLVGARRDSIKKLRASAEYLDSIWVRCRVSKSVGTSASVVGGSLTIAGGILTLTTAGLAAPLLIAGIATSSVGAATNIGTSLAERIINSKQVRDMGEALTRDKELTLKIETQIEMLRRYRDSQRLDHLLGMAEGSLGRDHIVVAILDSVLGSDKDGVGGTAGKVAVASSISSGFISDSVHASLVGMAACEEKTLADGVIVNVAVVEEEGGGGGESETSDTSEDTKKSTEVDKEEKKEEEKEEITERKEEAKSEVTFLVGDEERIDDKSSEEPQEEEEDDPKPDVTILAEGVEAVSAEAEEATTSSHTESGHTEAAKLAAAGAAAGGVAVATATAKQAGKATTKVVAREGLKYNPLGADVFLETGKVVGQNGTRLAGQVIVGVSAAFLAWDVIDLGWNVAELVRKKGSQAGKVLRDKADELDQALKDTTENFSVEMMRD